MTVTGFSLDNLVQLSMLFIIGAGQIVTWRSIGRDGRAKAVEHSAEKARLQAEQTSAIEAQAAAYDRLAQALEGVKSWMREHERSDDKWQATMAESHRQMTEAVTRLANWQEGQQREITALARDQMNPQPAAEVPPNMGQRRRRPGAD